MRGRRRQTKKVHPIFFFLVCPFSDGYGSGSDAVHTRGSISRARDTTQLRCPPAPDRTHAPSRTHARAIPNVEGQSITLAPPYHLMHAPISHQRRAPICSVCLLAPRVCVRRSTCLPRRLTLAHRIAPSCHSVVVLDGVCTRSPGRVAIPYPVFGGSTRAPRARTAREARRLRSMRARAAVSPYRMPPPAALLPITRIACVCVVPSVV